MKCPKCGGKAIVKNTLHTDDNETYRRIRCIHAETCGHVFWTIEYEIEYDDRLKKEIAKCERAQKNIQRIKKLKEERMSKK